MKKISIVVFILVIIVIIFGIYKYSNTSTPNTGKMYSDPDYHMSFYYPDQMQITSFTNPDNSKVILIKASSTIDQGIQIVVQTLNEPETTTITKERIQHDVPSLGIFSDKDIVVDNIGKGIEFYDGTSTTSQKQAWFVANDVLYQLTSTPEYVDTLDSVIRSWKFDLNSKDNN